MDLSLLNLDSDGVLATVNQDEEQALPPTLIDYSLTNSADENKPVWTVKIHDQKRGKGTLDADRCGYREIIPDPVAPAPEETLAAAEEQSGTEPVKPKKSPAHSRERSHGAPDIVENVVREVEHVGSKLKHFLPFP